MGNGGVAHEKGSSWHIVTDVWIWVSETLELLFPFPQQSDCFGRVYDQRSVHLCKRKGKGNGKKSKYETSKQLLRAETSRLERLRVFRDHSYLTALEICHSCLEIGQE